MTVDEEGFEKEMQQQKIAAVLLHIDTEDWIVLKEGTNKFVGYDSLETKAKLLNTER